MTKRKLTSTNNINRNFLTDNCGSAYALDLLSGRWKLKIIYKLVVKNARFSELKKQIPNITDRMLTLQLKELEEGGLVERTVYAEVPPRVEYKLTKSAKKLFTICEKLEKWGNEHREILEVNSIN